jgi:hypothetical protein
MSDAGDEEAAGGGGAPRDFTEITTQSYCGRMKSALTGVCVGFLLFFGSIAVLIWNEGRTVKRAKDIDEGQENVVQVDLSGYAAAPATRSLQQQTASNLSSSGIDLSRFENKLVFVTGDLSTTDALVDPVFGVGSEGREDANATATTDSATVLKLQRYVEMYQWYESRSSRTVKTSGGGTRTETTYSYDRRWSTSLVDSTYFKEQTTNRQNPTSFPFDYLELEADPILLAGLIQLGPAVVDRINWFEPVSDVALEDVPDAQLRSNLTLYRNDGFYYGTGTQAAPQVGDTRVTFRAVPADTISIVALYRPSNELDSWTTSRGGSLLLVQRGTFTSDELFQQADEANTTTAWIIRFVGFAVMVLSILLILQPIATAVDIIPFVGDCMSSGLESCILPMIAFLIAIPVSLFTIALAWLAYRPQWSVPILVGSALFMLLLYSRYRRNHRPNNKPNQQEQDEQPSSFGGGKVDDPYAAAQSMPVVAQTAGQSPYAANPYAASAPPGAVATAGGFASALDQPPPAASNPPPTAPHYNAEEPEINTNQPYVPEVSKPFVPHVYKP